mmetsp:Transcript_12533/g.27674  ORF Transcript_12533/g.27674 Transcript_12533/m.27674 type:complete len:342 (-) Transcript_12533:319-1344(-)|eukprot:CAMPEP_0113306600 /NCGR_PEP_ID=MMETSP0010_2-20120614/5787_1 /TAXON_ID=216773 ORGANISM="Corethron hystrix, Strain 308" /NCGR_SAMPLE_ID=MMETSP0010_2 /ASSEMBLY_ACC=CAM_ASM_000155 /LENGTH=341 /DNA_ID=CAMNT_0000161301 /DNA_START=342 /DNA_END=1367 /DNA_ORIENTATION=- /assembly_acc=CAM_ASM_000155
MRLLSKKNFSSLVAVAVSSLLCADVEAFLPSTARRSGDLLRRLHTPSYGTLRPPSPLFMSTALYQMDRMPTNSTFPHPPPSRPVPQKRSRRRRSDVKRKKRPPSPPLAPPPLVPSALTVEELYRAIKHAHKTRRESDLELLTEFLTVRTDASFGYGYRGSLLSRAAVAALSLRRMDLAAVLLAVRRRDHSGAAAPTESAALVRALDRAGRRREAKYVLEDELPLPSVFEEKGGAQVSEREREVLIQRTLGLRSIALWDFLSDDARGGVEAMRRVRELGPMARRIQVDMEEELRMNWERLIEVAEQCQALRKERMEKEQEDGCDLVRSVLEARKAFFQNMPM